MEGVHREDNKFPREAEPESLGAKVPQWVQGQSSSKGSGDKVLQKLKQNVKLVYNF